MQIALIGNNELSLKLNILYLGKNLSMFGCRYRMFLCFPSLHCLGMFEIMGTTFFRDFENMPRIVRELGVSTLWSLKSLA